MDELMALLDSIAAVRAGTQEMIERVDRAVAAGLMPSPSSALESIRIGLHGLRNLAQIAEAERWLRQQREGGA